MSYDVEYTAFLPVSIRYKWQWIDLDYSAWLTVEFEMEWKKVVWMHPKSYLCYMPIKKVTWPLSTDSTLE